MNNALDIALSRIRVRIPSQILDIAFAKREPWDVTCSHDEMILNHIIRAFVLKDTNIFGGKQKQIILRPEYKEKLQFNVDDGYLHTGPFSLFRIPAEAREGQPIVEVHGVAYRGNYSDYIPQTAGWPGGVNLSVLGHAVLDSHTFSSSPVKPNIELLTSDLVRLWPPQHSFVIWVMTCRIAYDQDFTNLNTSAMDTFAEVCVEATKMFIYNKIVIPMDEAHIQAGQQIGEIKRIVDSYSEAPQRYKELMTQLAGTMLLDPVRLQSILPYML